MEGGSLPPQLYLIPPASSALFIHPDTHPKHVIYLVHMGIIIPNMIPGSNEEICRNKVFLGGKYSPNFCLSSVEEVGAGRFPVPHQTCSSGVHVCPIRGNQFKTIAKRKWFWCKVANSSCERYNTIVVDLYMNKNGICGICDNNYAGHL